MDNKLKKQLTDYAIDIIINGKPTDVYGKEKYPSSDDWDWFIIDDRCNVALNARNIGRAFMLIIQKFMNEFNCPNLIGETNLDTYVFVDKIKNSVLNSKRIREYKVQFKKDNADKAIQLYKDRIKANRRQQERLKDAEIELMEDLAKFKATLKDE